MISFQEFEEFVPRSSFLSNLHKDVLKNLYSHSTEIIAEKGDTIIREGSVADEVLIVLTGELEIVKYDAVNDVDHVIAHVHVGDTFGELALLDPAPRSASLRCVKPSRILKISFANLHKLRKNDPEFSIFMELGKNISRRFRKTNQMALDALKNQLQEYRKRVFTGQLLIYLLTFVSIFVFILPLLTKLLSIVSDSMYVSLPVVVVIFCFFCALFRSSKLPLKFFGVTTKGWKQGCISAVTWSIPIGAIIVGFKWLAIRYYPIYEGHVIFEPFIFLPEDKKTFIYWFANLVGYWTFVPLQEFVVRGVLQGLLCHFITAKYKVFISIFISNLLFGMVHIFLSEIVGIAIFFTGLYMGYLYSTSRTLISPIVAHLIIGAWAFQVVGFIL